MITRNLIYAVILILGFTACRKTEVENQFYTSPEARMNDTLSFIRKQLTSAQNGWKGGFSTGSRGGYGFFFQFNNDETVSMLSDYSTTSASTPQTSTYRVSALSLPTLLFDTYNYISLMQDPNPSAAGGTSGVGYKSDTEFLYVKAHGDTLFFKGKKYTQPFILVKATEAEKTQFLAAGINTFVTNFSKVYNDNYVFSYLDANPKLKLGIEIDYSGKTTKFSYIDEAGNINSIISSAFYYGVNDLSLAQFINYNGKLIKSLKFEGSNIVAVYSDNTTAVIKSQTMPLYALESAFAYNKNFKKIVTGTTIPGVTSTVHIFDRVRELFTTSGRSISSMYFAFTNSTTAVFYIAYSSGTSNFTASATYQYRREGNKLFMKRTAFDANFNTRATEVAPVNTLFGTGDEREFFIDWASSSDKTVKFPIGAIKSASSSNNMLYGRLGE